MGILEKMRLDGKKIFITGGARGIGKCIAYAMAEAGADVALVDIDIAEAEKTAAQLAKDTGVSTMAHKADITVPEQVDAMIDSILKKFGRIDVAFCNAGICIDVPAEDMSYKQWFDVINVNLTGVFLTAQAAGRVMIRQGGGSIINTGSMSGHIVNVPQPECGYAASKAGVIMLTKSLAVEWAPHHVRVNSISPGYMATELTLESKELKPLIPLWYDKIPMRRLGDPMELQSVALYLAGDTSSYTTGSDFIVDGGYTAL